MKSFMEEYGMAIIAAVVILILITISTPIGQSMTREFFYTIGVFQNDKKDICTIYMYSGEGRFDNGESMMSVEVERLKEIGDVLPNPTVNNGIFTGWYTSPNSGEQVTNTFVIKGDTKVYAHYRFNPFVPSNLETGINNGVLRVDGTDLGIFKAGTEFQWHNYDWKVLEVKNNTALVISKNVLDEHFSADTYDNGIAFQPSSISGSKVNNYSISKLSSELESGFYVDKLSRDPAILATNIDMGLYNNESLYSLGTVNTRHVFALSYTETRKYMENTSSKIAYNGDIKRAYWTRSGSGEDEVMVVYDDGRLVNVKVTNSFGVRPAMYLDMTKISDIKLINN